MALTRLTSRRFPLRFDRWYAVLSRAVLLRPAATDIENGDREVTVEMGWAVRACFSNWAIIRSHKSRARLLSRGVYGFAGPWLVNGSGRQMSLSTLHQPLPLLPGRRSQV